MIDGTNCNYLNPSYDFTLGIDLDENVWYELVVDFQVNAALQTDTPFFSKSLKMFTHIGDNLLTFDSNYAMGQFEVKKQLLSDTLVLAVTEQSYLTPIKNNPGEFITYTIAVTFS